jgi:hypothetical protein
MQTALKRNRLTFGLGTIGRDMVYSIVSMYLDSRFYVRILSDLRERGDLLPDNLQGAS